MSIGTTSQLTAFSGEPQATASFPARLAAAAIRGYQRWISPYKGFRCAHRALHGGHSCSEFARLAILEYGITQAWPGIRQQFRECRAAFLHLRQQRRAMLSATDSDEYDIDDSDEPDDTDRVIDDRFYEESERKRKRLAELPGSETPMSNLSDMCGACGACAVLEPFVCCGPW
jgi:putative component of membrane protein insertase Oxa1/YidC/SpoIIIJ protein YidD